MSLLARMFGRQPPREPAADRGDAARVGEVEQVLEELRGTFAADGGDVRVAWVRGGVVALELRGACAGCAASAMTLELAIRPRLRARCPWFERVERLP